MNKRTNIHKNRCTIIIGLTLRVTNCKTMSHLIFATHWISDCMQYQSYSSFSYGNRWVESFQAISTCHNLNMLQNDFGMLHMPNFYGSCKIIDGRRFFVFLFFRLFIRFGQKNAHSALIMDVKNANAILWTMQNYANSTKYFNKNNNRCAFDLWEKNADKHIPNDHLFGLIILFDTICFCVVQAFIYRMVCRISFRFSFFDSYRFFFSLEQNKCFQCVSIVMFIFRARFFFSYFSSTFSKYSICLGNERDPFKLNGFFRLFGCRKFNDGKCIFSSEKKKCASCFDATNLLPHWMCFLLALSRVLFHSCSPFWPFDASRTNLLFHLISSARKMKAELGRFFVFLFVCVCC